MSDQTFLFFAPEGFPAAHDRALAALADLGAAIAPPAGYRPGSWRHAATGAHATFDAGEPPLEHDHLHRPRVYQGWSPVHLGIQVPLAGPHWHAVESYALVEAVLAAEPAWRALDVEDINETPDHDPGPFAWSRPRALGQWEQQRAAQVEGRRDLFRMHRGASLRLWRYRRERAAGRAARGDLRWPDAIALGRRGEAVSACLWEDPARALALPPVELVVVPRRRDAVVIPAAALAPSGTPAGHGLAIAIAPLAHPPEGGGLDGMRALLDEEWLD